MTFAIISIPFSNNKMVSFSGIFLGKGLASIEQVAKKLPKLNLQTWFLYLQNVLKSLCGWDLVQLNHITVDVCIFLISMHGLFFQQKKYTRLCYQQLKLVHSVTTENNGYKENHEPKNHPE